MATSVPRCGGIVSRRRGSTRSRVMNDRDRDAFVRWQARAIDQMSFVTNLLIGLATGLVALEAQSILDGKIRLGSDDRLLGLASLGCVSLSLILGLILAWN